ncbi:hypothetical protein AB6A40_006509 [Gnathostoma spinigerum]|uniref:Fibronectin type-III domain-containing protein n=1 Tax=Gnathostoma spinigerum TaxID=75299 RepID=A0ABD6EU75_9BILA
MCNAVSPNGSSSSRNVDLAVSSVVLPITPRFVLKCCSDSQISDSCQRACSVAPHYNQNCSEYSRELLKCASDGRDHRQCCVHAGVPLDCLPICKGVTTLNQPHCDAYATRAVACMIKGHEKAPNTPGPMFYTKLSPTTAKIFWNEPESNSYRIYALYYRKENDDDDFKIKKTVDNVVVLHDLDPDVSYNLALVAANAHGHSAFVELTVPSLGHDNRHGFVVVFGVIIVLLFVSAAVFATLRLRKGRSLPTVLRRFRRSSPLSSRDTTVAFENPGFGSEVQIRGLSQSDEPFNSDWQNTELEVPVSSNMRQNSEINNGGMRYAKLGPL